MADNFTKKIVITTNTKEAETALARLRLQFKSLGESVEHIGMRLEGVSRASENFMGKLERLGVASVFAEAGIFGLANKVADMGFELGEAAIKTGLTTKEFQYWSYVAKQSGMSADELTGTIGRLYRNLGQARNPTSQQAQALKYLGISLRDSNGHLKSTNEIYKEVLISLGKVPDRQMQAAASNALLGKSYQSVLPQINAMKTGMKENTEEFNKYAMVLSQDAIEQSDKFHRTSINLQTSLSSLAQAVGMQLIPVLQPLIKSMADYTAENREAIATNIAKTILEISDAFKEAWAIMKPVAEVLKTIVVHLGGLKTVIIAIVSYYMLSLISSFVVLTFQVGLATASILSFVGASVLQGFGAFVRMLALARDGLIALDVVALLNPVGLAIVAIGAAIALVVTHLKEFKKIRDELKGALHITQIENKIDKWGGSFVKPQNITGSSFLGGMETSAVAPAANGVPTLLNKNKSSGGNAQTGQLNIHMKIDHEGKPSIIGVQSNSDVNFTSNLGILRQ